MSMDLVSGALSLDDLQRLHAGGAALRIDAASREHIRVSAAVVQRAAAGDAPVYGVTPASASSPERGSTAPTWRNCSST